jgi:hypothetical protein
MQLTFKSFIKHLSKNKNYSTVAEDIERWKNLPHTAVGLDLFLKHNITEIKVTSNKKITTTYICTSNLGVLSKLSNIDIASFNKMTEHSLNDKPPKVLTYNFLSKQLLSIVSDKWEIQSFVTIREENIDILSEMIKNTVFK